MLSKRVIRLIGLLFALTVVIGMVLNQQSLGPTPASLQVELDGVVIRKGLDPFYKPFDRLEDLEEEAELIIIAEPINHLADLLQNEAGHGHQAREKWVDTSLQVHQVVKGVYDAPDITIPQWIFVDYEHVLVPSGYSPFVKNARYVLFLAKSTFGGGAEDPYVWNVISGNYGKVNLDGRDHIEDLFSDDKQQKLKKKVIRKYQSFQNK
jgi:hypothetical protein